MFPAPAGINRRSHCIRRYDNSVPRASGDKPLIRSLLISHSRCSPRQRGGTIERSQSHRQL
ncbi:hypothetical protein DKC05_12895 [Serratia marcescens]|uniref:Uncharacterized protein n=1 Tax=Serratia marcescens TaxID=615 RepID=A0AB33G3R6_SERMA|nr:hypothetical protein DKC05_12895 [Serratia marcescens]